MKGTSRKPEHARVHDRVHTEGEGDVERRTMTMRYQVSTTLMPPAVLEQAIAHFGPQGAGLQVTAHNKLGIVFQGGGGHVALTIQPGTEESVLELETREWDFPVRQFMTHVSRRPPWWQRWWRRKQRPAPAPASFTILNND